MTAEFADTNVVLYVLDDGSKADRAEVILGQGPRVSVQVLNEPLVNCRRKAGLSWDEANAFLAGVRALCPVEDLTLRTHDVGRALAERGHARRLARRRPIEDLEPLRLSVRDAMCAR